MAILYDEILNKSTSTSGRSQLLVVVKLIKYALLLLLLLVVEYETALTRRYDGIVGSLIF